MSRFNTEIACSSCVVLVLTNVVTNVVPNVVTNVVTNVE